jgi:hypothetical protein
VRVATGSEGAALTPTPLPPGAPPLAPLPPRHTPVPPCSFLFCFEIASAGRPAALPTAGFEDYADPAYLPRSPRSSSPPATRCVAPRRRRLWWCLVAAGMQ